MPECGHSQCHPSTNVEIGHMPATSARDPPSQPWGRETEKKMLKSDRCLQRARESWREWQRMSNERDFRQEEPERVESHNVDQKVITFARALAQCHDSRAEHCMPPSEPKTVRLLERTRKCYDFPVDVMTFHPCSYSGRTDVREKVHWRAATGERPTKIRSSNRIVF